MDRLLFTVTHYLRIALVVDPFRLKLRGGDHAPSLARELLGRGHVVRGFGAPPRVIPRAGAEPTVGGGVGADVGAGLLKFRPDVIVAYDALSPAAWTAARRARRLDVPLILVEEGLPGHGNWIERLRRWIGEHLWGPYVRRKTAAVVALDAVAHAQALTAGFEPGLVRTQPVGLDLQLYRPGLTSHLPSQHGIRGRVLLFVGRLEPELDLQVLVNAFAATVGRRGDWFLMLAGDGPARVRLRALADRLGVGAQVHWIGPPRREELPGLLGSATLYVAPSLERELTGWRVRRALACGLPVLAGRGLRAEGLVEHDGCGMLVTPGDLQAWTDALRLCAGSPGRRKRWGRRARELAQERYAWPLVAERFEQVLTQACAPEESRAETSPEASSAR